MLDFSISYSEHHTSVRSHRDSLTGEHTYVYVCLAQLPAEEPNQECLETTQTLRHTPGNGQAGLLPGGEGKARQFSKLK